MGGIGATPGFDDDCEWDSGQVEIGQIVFRHADEDNESMQVEGESATYACDRGWCAQSQCT